MDGEFFRKGFNTALDPKAEADYKLWLLQQSMARGRDMSMDESEYDMRGYFNAGKDLDNDQGHFPDTYKKPNHPTFSNESMYHGSPRPDGSRFVGGRWGHDGTADTFEPSPEMINGGTHQEEFLRGYFRDVKPSARLIIKRRQP